MRLRPMFASLICVSPLLAASASIQYSHEIRQNPPLHIHAASVNLAAGIEIRVVRSGEDPDGVGPWTTTLHPVREVSEKEGFDFAVNGDFFIPGEQKHFLGQLIKYPLGSPARVCGTAMTDGVLWQIGLRRFPSFTVDANGKVAIGIIDKHPNNVRQITCGSTLLVGDGNVVKLPHEAPSPHTAVGIDREGKKLTFLVIDGRRPDYSGGLSIEDLAQEMLKRGCWDALNLDGGGSSTMVMRDGGVVKLLNRPSDGYQLPIPLSIERPVASVVGVTVKNASTTRP